MAGSIRFRAYPTAAKVLTEVARPALRQAADRIGPAIVAHVPVVDGVVVRTYKPRVEQSDTGFHVIVGSPFWHWLEFGTATSPAYRPVERGVRSLGLNYRPM